MKILYTLERIPKFLLICLIAFPFAATAQEEVYTLEIHSRGLQRVGNTFESAWLIDNQTVMVPMRRTAEFDIQHRFGTVNNGYSDLWGVYAPSNIRIGLSYVPINNLMVGAAITKDRMLMDFSAKYAILREDGGKYPLSLTYFTNMAIDSRDKENFKNTTDRFSYFHQLLIAKKLNSNLSVQGALSLSHFNRVEAFIDEQNVKQGRMKNDHLGFSLSGRYKISDAMAFIGNYDQPITKHLMDNPNPNVSFGLEIATPLHAFQVFLGNYRWIVPQYNNALNYNDVAKGEILIGFNITRLLDMQEEDLMHMLLKRRKK